MSHTHMAVPSATARTGPLDAALNATMDHSSSDNYAVLPLDDSDEDDVTIKRSHSGDRNPATMESALLSSRRRTSSEEMYSVSHSSSYGSNDATSDHRSPYWYDPHPAYAVSGSSPQHATNYQYQLWQYEQYVAAYAAQQTMTPPPSTMYPSHASSHPRQPQQQPYFPPQQQPAHPSLSKQPLRSRVGSSPQSQRKGHARSHGAPSHFTFEPEVDVSASLLRGTGPTSYGAVPPAEGGVRMATAAPKPGERLPPSRANSIGHIKSTDAVVPTAVPLRTHSISPLRGGGAHRRAISDGDRRLVATTRMGRGVAAPMDPSSRTRRPRSSPKLARPTHSPTASVGNGNGGSSHGHHRRGSSLASMGAMSYMSDASMVSVVSNIRKSVYFDRVEKTGHAQLSFSLSKVHLITLEDPSKGDRRVDTAVHTIVAPPAVSDLVTIDGYPLKLGRLYKVPISNQEYEEYHKVFDDSSLGFAGDYDDLDVEENRLRCRCECPHCASCVDRTGSAALAANYFCLTIDDTIYRRLLDDVCASQEMPCGLYFCGHHEDVSRPSIAIAVGFLVVVFGAMGLVALCF